ncbi:hypothetical protein FAZ69_19955 [Trinickia terrae]|uniref:Uncharacterized protein n=1 Tax=Trinickia terrae TaxID=2571161 RepID=A0A4U1I196_9BURK|nr:hypothetical protein [Trinickia terrae]TKC86906.1 hypothetical protein FAZ69_19955 [Trinickia terrae]
MSNHAFAASAAETGKVEDSADDFAAIVELARQAGMLVTLDGQIGREKYQSIGGSLASFRRFVEALRGSLGEQLAA